jgi:hypothetical protein
MITRHHYEEMFLLYVDNELSLADRRRVEDFIKENPDLREELVALHQCRFIPEEEDSFGNREPLLKYAAAERFILPVRRFPFTRIAAAVLFLLLAGLIIFFARRTGDPASLVNAGSRSTGLSNDSSIAGTGTANVAAKDNMKKERKAVTSVIPQTLYLSTTVQQHRSNKEKSQASGAGDPQNNEARLVSNNLHPDLALQHPPDLSGDETLTKTKLAARRELTRFDPVNTGTPEKIVVADANSRPASSLAIPAVQQEPALSADDFAQQAPPEKNKLRGVFRKISRVFEKTADRDDDRHGILIGNLQIALK